MPIQRVASWVSVALGRDSGVVNRLRPWYEQALVLMTLDRGLSWSLNGMPCRIDPRQRHRMARDYDQPVALWLSQHVKAGDLCANVGGNIGVYALQFAHWNGPEGRVVVFEPNPYARAVLARHIRYNHFNARIQVIDAAVAETNGTATFYASNTADGMSRLGMPNHELLETVPMVVHPSISTRFFSSARVDDDRRRRIRAAGAARRAANHFPMPGHRRGTSPAGLVRGRHGRGGSPASASESMP